MLPHSADNQNLSIWSIAPPGGLTFGFVIGILDISLGMDTLPPEWRASAGRPATPGERLVLWQGCATMYGIAYGTGRLLYDLLGTRDDRDLPGFLRWHLIVFNMLGGLFLLTAWVQPGGVRPAMFVGPLMAGFAMLDGWRAWRKKGAASQA